MKNKAEEIAQRLRVLYGLTYRSSVNLEAALNNAMAAGLNAEAAEAFATDLLDNVEFLDLDETPS